jgi:transcriptional regulator with XRE-family HTH domain
MRSLPVAFGRAVRRLRTEAGLSQERFAAKAGISRTYMSEIERGVTLVSLESIARVAKALGLTISALLRSVEDAR